MPLTEEDNSVTGGILSLFNGIYSPQALPYFQCYMQKIWTGLGTRLWGSLNGPKGKINISFVLGVTMMLTSRCTCLSSSTRYEGTVPKKK